VTQASFLEQGLLRLFPARFRAHSEQFPEHQLLGNGNLGSKIQRHWNLGLGLLLIATLLNWRLVFATGMGGLLATGVWFMLQDSSVSPRTLFESWMKSKYWPLGWTFGVGFFTMVTTYGAIAIGIRLDQPWLGVELMLQQLGMVTVLTLVIWQLWHNTNVHGEKASDAKVITADSGTHQSGLAAPPPSWQPALTDLTHGDPLRRLMTVRHLTQACSIRPTGAQTVVGEISQAHLVEYFQLMLHQETEPLIRHALRESLGILTAEQQLLGAGAPPLAMPIRPFISNSKRIPVRKLDYEELN